MSATERERDYEEQRHHAEQEEHRREEKAGDAFEATGRPTPMRLDDYTRTERGQELLDRAQEVRAGKRAKDPVWPILDAVEAIAAAASCLDGSEPVLATRLRRTVDFVLDVYASATEMALEETKRRVVADFRRHMASAPPAEGMVPPGETKP